MNQTEFIAGKEKLMDKDEQERENEPRRSLLNRIINLYKKFGLILLIIRIFQKGVFAYIRFLNKRRLEKITKNTKSLIKEINGSKMRLDVSMDDGLCRYLLIAGIREAYMTQIMKEELKEGDIVVDIGANVGYYALLESKIVGDKGKIYAIEPVPETISLFKENIKLNNYSNIDIYQLAIGDTNGKTTMYVSKWLNRSQMKEIGIKTDIISHEINVPLSTLDNFLKDKSYPQVIRMDVEGYEYNVIKGMVETLEQKKPLKLFIEFHFRWLKVDKCIELLKILKEADFEIANATYETDEYCITKNKVLKNIATYLNSKFYNLPLKGQLKLTIDDILNNAIVWNNNEGALDLCLRLGALEIMFKRAY